MNERMRTIRLYGTLGARFGRQWRLAVSTPAEAVRALCTLVPGFRRYLVDAKDLGVVFAVFRGKENLSQEQLADPCGGFDIRIAPVIQGAKRGGVLQTIVGAALIVAGVLVTPYAPVAARVLTQMGWAMAVGGVVQMLTGTSRGLSSSDSVENSPNYNFNGVVNTQAQGNPVPIGYGRMLVGSAVISGGIYAEDQQ